MALTARVRSAMSGRLTRTEAAVLLGGKSADEWKLVAGQANKVRRTHCGDRLRVSAVVMLSNRCDRHCTFCPWRAYNRTAIRWRTPDEVAGQAIERSAALGVDELVLLGGDGDWVDPGAVARLAEMARQQGLEVALGFGDRSDDDFRLWRRAGASAYFITPLTTNVAIFDRIHPDRSLDDFISLMERLREMGYRLTAGPMVGLPGQTPDDLAGDLEFFRDQAVATLRVTRFVPATGTPLGSQTPVGSEGTLSTIAVGRLMMPEAHIPATATWDADSDVDRAEALASGADSALVVLARGGRLEADEAEAAVSWLRNAMK